MPSQDNEYYIQAVNWIIDNPDDISVPMRLKIAFLRFVNLSPEKKSNLLLDLLKITKLPSAIGKSLPELTFDLQGLPEELYSEIAAQLNTEADKSSLVCVSKNIHAFLQPGRLFDKFLQRVAYGDQDKAEKLFKDVYKGNIEKIQAALLHQGTFTDFSGRTFHCSAYEYAYWAKDTHMCRMLESYMDVTTKAKMLNRIDEIENTGLSYTQHGVEQRTRHFDFTPLIHALKTYIEGYENWIATNSQALITAAWLQIGLAQRDIPAHAAQEYCREDRSFFPCPEFNETTLPRNLTFYDAKRECDVFLFPLDSNVGLGFTFALMRGAWSKAAEAAGEVGFYLAHNDLEAITRLDAVRTADLIQSRANLTGPSLQGYDSWIASGRY
ncbi:SidC homolog (plasmid) [Legionella adelaidensis]|uniref:SidC homolog n=1 Tax=Legionella adelaidensis TaxID=45056 RepID=A0A0W0R1X7_9GAMM|nr:hypothetical protein [Legionella adelaidensis]KTC65034.1 hypothetical protein Lade_1557 [Legionella adelaidensis]VEH85447.1 SidC homolog [Legionella adelaidensis]